MLVVGGGAREHAIAKALSRDDCELYAYLSNRNPGIIRLSVDHVIGMETDVERVADKASSWGIDLAFIGPEAPLGIGIVDVLISSGIDCIGPTKDAARIETSKEFMRRLMERHSIKGNVRFGTFTDPVEASEFIEGMGGKVAVKPVGLTGGKGVKVYGDHFISSEDAAAYAKEVIERKIGGVSAVVVEELLEGEEFTLQAFVDGSNLIPMPAVQDHKRAYEGDRGPNTGGMGSYSQSDGLLPFMTRDEYERAVEIMRSVVHAMHYEGYPYKGILYGQFMLTAYGPKVVEFNVRLGDPEAMNVLPLLKDSMLEIGFEIVNGELRPHAFREMATVCKYVVPRGYGTSPVEGAEIRFTPCFDEGIEYFFASVNEVNGRIYTTRSRSMAVLGIAPRIEDAEELAEKGLRGIEGDIYIRHDIAKQAAIEAKIRHMEEVRLRAKRS